MKRKALKVTMDMGRYAQLGTDRGPPLCLPASIPVLMPKQLGVLVQQRRRAAIDRRRKRAG